MAAPAPIHSRQIGRAGPVVLLVHGFPLDGSMWDAAAALLADSFRLVIPDLRGFGLTPPAPRPDMASYADDLAALLDSLSIDRPALIAGLSFGGYVLMEFLRRHPERVDAIGLIDTREVADTPQAAASRREQADRLGRAEPVSIVVDPVLPLMIPPDAPAPFRNHWRTVMLAQSPAGIAGALRAMADRPDSSETLRAFRGRALLVAGARDAITPADVHERMARLLPRPELHLIPGAGHLAPAEEPAAFARIVRGFLSSRC